MIRSFLLTVGLVCVLVLGAGGAAQAIFIEKPLDDPAEEARAQRLMKELRCLVCQNQSISESNAGLAQDLRVLLRERLDAGDSDREALDFMVVRYGDWVLLEPPVKSTTYILWAGPAVIVLVVLIFLTIFLRNRSRQVATQGAGPAAKTLSEAERAELDRYLMQDAADNPGGNRDNKGA